MKNILVIRFSSLGDVLLTTGPLCYIKEELPHINIDVLTMAPFAGIFANFPYVRDVYCIDKGASFKSLLAVLNSMPEYDGVFDLHSNLRSMAVKAVLSYPSFTYNKNSLARRLYVRLRLCRWRLAKHTAEKYCEPLAKALRLPMPPLERLRPYIVNLGKREIRREKIVSIHPFASKNAKVWPYFYELSAALIEEGLQVRFIGDGKFDVPKGAEDRTGFASINALIRNIADSDIFLSTDSGPMHLAVALNVPTLAIFGPTTKELGFYPLFKGCGVIEYSGLKCRPCHIHGPDACPLKHFRCMLSIGVEEVRHRVLKTLENQSSL